MVRAYRSFDTDRPRTLVDRFLEHQPEHVHLQAEIKLKEELQTALEGRRAQLR